MPIAAVHRTRRAAAGDGSAQVRLAGTASSRRRRASAPVADVARNVAVAAPRPSTLVERPGHEPEQRHHVGERQHAEPDEEGGERRRSAPPVISPRMTPRPIARATPVLPISAGDDQPAQIRNGTISRPITDAATMASTGTASSSTSSPADEGAERTLADHVGRRRDRAVEHGVERQVDRGRSTTTTAQTHSRSGTISRPQSSPW